MVSCVRVSKVHTQFWVGVEVPYCLRPGDRMSTVPPFSSKGGGGGGGGGGGRWVTERSFGGCVGTT